METFTTQTLDEGYEALPDLADPHALINRMRDEAPVYHAPDGLWYVHTYDLLAEVVRTPEIWASNHIVHAGAGADPYINDPKKGTFSEVYRSMILFQDGDAHKRLRLLSQPIFTPRKMNAFRATVRSAVDAQFDDAVELSGSTRQMDFRAHFTLPMPNRIILDMFGIPQQEAHRFEEMTDLIVPPLEREAPERWLASADEIYDRHMAYILAIAAERSAGEGNDLVRQIANARDAEGKPLSDLELVGFVSFLVTAGYETTANTFSSGMYWLLSNPDQFELLKANPDLIPQAVEEMLRFDPATRNTGPRYATQDTVIGGHEVKKGERMLASIHGANRDPAYFDRPDTFDITRDPNPHMTFIGGPHGCLGKPLARMEMQEALHAVIERFPGLTLAEDEPAWHSSRMIRGLDSLPVRW